MQMRSICISARVALLLEADLIGNASILATSTLKFATEDQFKKSWK
jgi:hypothetical protein